MDWFSSLETAATAGDLAEVRSILNENLDQFQFLAGPGRGEEDIEIDSIFGKRFNRVIDEVLDYDPNALEIIRGSPVTKSCVVEGYSFAEVDSGIVLLDPNDIIVGGYLSCDLSLKESHQGQGLGAELIIECLLRKGEIPTWNLDTAAFSPAGYAAHVSAFSKLINDPQMVTDKLTFMAESDAKKGSHFAHP